MRRINGTLYAESQNIIYVQENFNKSLCFHNSSIPSLRVTFLFCSVLPLLSFMFRVCRLGNQAAWAGKRFISGRKKNYALSSLSSRWLRSSQVKNREVF